ncbi:uncharacterized protein LOC111435501 [Cucurbita moschata]|uniref:Uncharacterized protein LOC111435501 n=1 Tax=Cucurbita moschata TaxID=3662 RepID=A0A6J1EPN6_CUCMO|nr:uncharacterized protein LOC111435501 [Cucurbita moschata]
MAISGPFSLKYNEKYLSYINDNSELHGFLQFSGDDPPSTYSLFKVEMAKTAEQLFSIRSVFNEKYWVCRLSNNEHDEHWIVAEADEPNEDQSSLTCTLFKWIFIDSDRDQVQLRHVNLNMNVSVSETYSQSLLSIFGNGLDPSARLESDVFELFKLWDVASSKEPTIVAFKGDNGKYLQVDPIDGIAYLKFSADDNQPSTVWFECHHTDHGMYIRSKSNGLLWRHDSKVILADCSTDHLSPDFNSLFHIKRTKTKENKELVSLCVGKFYCQRNNESGHMKDCLVAYASNITGEAEVRMDKYSRKLGAYRN